MWHHRMLPVKDLKFTLKEIAWNNLRTEAFSNWVADKPDMHVTVVNFCSELW